MKISLPPFQTTNPIPFFFTMSTPIIKNATMRIAKRIARSGTCSRREAEKLIDMGVVRINGVLISSPAVNVTPFDTVSVNGEDLPPIQRTRVVIANKLSGELVTKNDEKGRMREEGLICRKKNYLRSS